MTAVTVNDITEATLEGVGIFDVLMRANKAHLEAEFSKNRIKGSEYAMVYLGSMEAVLRASMEFLVQRQKIDLEAQLLTQQIALAQVEVTKANATLALVNAQTANALAENTVITNTGLKVAEERLFITQKTATEKAQIDGVGVQTNSYLGKQMSVLEKQASGYIRDAEQKATKIMTDAHVALLVSDVSAGITDSHLSADYVSEMINALALGIGVNAAAIVPVVPTPTPVP